MKTLLLMLTIATVALFASTACAAICVSSGTVTLSWTANLEDDLAYYDVYESGTVDGAYAKIASVSATSYAVVGLAEGDHYFKLKAVDQCGNESEFSDPSEVIHIDNTPPEKAATITITVATP